MMKGMLNWQQGAASSPNFSSRSILVFVAYAKRSRNPKNADALLDCMIDTIAREATKRIPYRLNGV